MRAAMIVSLAVAGAVGAAACGGAQSSGRTTPDNEGWSLVEPEGLGFVVEMPSPPSVSSDTDPTLPGPRERTVYRSGDEDDDISFYVILTKYPEGTFAGGYSQEQALSDMRAQFVAEHEGGDVERTWFLGAERVADKATMFIFRTDDGLFWRVRQYLRGDVMYQVAYATTSVPRRRQGAMFLRSFALF